MTELDFRYAITVTATYFTLLPITVGIYHFRYLKKADILFLSYLLYGFLTDFLVMTFNDTHNQFSWIVFNLFSLAEPFFLSLYFYLIAPVGWMKKLCLGFLILVLPVWLYFHIEFLDDVTVKGKLSGGFAAGYQVVFAFLSAYFLLLMTQLKADMVRSTVFWFVTSVFFCCFCSFFLNTFLETEYQKHVWIVYSCVNMLSYLVVSYGFRMSKRNVSLV